MFMGDLVLTENEISPVMKRLIDDGVRDHGGSQSSVANLPGGFLHACRRSGDPVKLGKPCMRGWP